MSQSISAKDLSRLLANGEAVEVIDVRTPVEFQEVHISVARNIPLDRLNPSEIMTHRTNDENKPLYIVCRSGSRGGQACQRFESAGYANVINVEGGTMACIKEGIAVVRGKKGVPLHCQVQIITGTLVMAGILLALVLSNQYWLLISFVMGAGLTFSGLTNTCAMGAVLAKMPWNQVTEACPLPKSSQSP